MKSLLNQLELVVTQVQNHPLNHPCKTNVNTGNKSSTDDFHTLAAQHKDHLITHAMNHESKEKFNRIIKLYQTSLISYLDRLYCTQSLCLQNSQKESCIKRESIQILTDLLRFIRYQFPDAFNNQMPIPYAIQQAQKEKLKEGLDNIYNNIKHKSPNNLLIATVTHPITDFLATKKKSYTFYHLKYLQSLMEKLLELSQHPHTNREFNRLICNSALEHNLNSKTCFDYFVAFISKEYRLKESKMNQLKRLVYYKKCVEQVFVTPNTSYDPSQKKLKSALSKWLNREIEFIKKSCHINERNELEQPINVKTAPKVTTTMSVPQLAYFIRQMIDTGLILTSNKSETIRFVCAHFSTLNTKNISETSFIAKFNKPNTSSIVETKNNIIKLLNSMKEN